MKKIRLVNKFPSCGCRLKRCGFRPREYLYQNSGILEWIQEYTGYIIPYMCNKLTKILFQNPLVSTIHRNPSNLTHFHTYFNKDSQL